MSARKNRRPKQECFDEIASALEYNHECGSLYWNREVTTHAPGDKLRFWLNNWGYAVTNFRGWTFPVHRLVWRVCTGAGPARLVDHINGDRADNRIENLREATHSQNVQNIGAMSTNKLGVKGVSWCKKGRHYVATLTVGGSIVYRGYFKTVEDAAAAYREAAKKHQGEFFPESLKKLPEREVA